jgi:glycerate kinase
MHVVVAPDKFKGSLTALEVAQRVAAGVDTAYAARGGIAVIEMADVSGLRRLPGGRLAALEASSYGTGEVIRAALDVWRGL